MVDHLKCEMHTNLRLKMHFVQRLSTQNAGVGYLSHTILRNNGNSKCKIRNIVHKMCDMHAIRCQNASFMSCKMRMTGCFPSKKLLYPAIHAHFRLFLYQISTFNAICVKKVRTLQLIVHWIVFNNCKWVCVLCRFNPSFAYKVLYLALFGCILSANQALCTHFTCAF